VRLLQNKTNHPSYQQNCATPPQKPGFLLYPMHTFRRISPWLWFILAAAATVRAWIYLRSPFSPGMNGAYYLVQARSLLEKGSLGIPDMPLTFSLHAAVALLLKTCGMESAAAISLAVKTLDSLLPPLVGLPVYLLVRRWPGANTVTALAAAAAASCGAHSLTMVGDFEKNALALVWLGWLAWALHSWVAGPSARSAWPVVLFAALLGLTHIGTLGAACGFGGLVTLLALALVEPAQRWALLRLLLGCALAIGVGTALVYTFFDPERAMRLVQALSDPSTIENSKHGNPGGMMGPGMNPGPNGPAGALVLMRWLPTAAMLGLGLGALVTALWQRQRLGPASAAVISGAALTILILGGPWWQMDKGMRFMLICGLPATLCASWLAATAARPWLKHTLTAVMALYAAGSLGVNLWRGPQPMMSEAARDELLAMKQLVPPGPRSLIVARHGLEWWVSWFVASRIAQPSGVEGSDWQQYEAVYYLTEKRSAGPARQSFGGPGARRGPGGGPRGPELPPNAELTYEGSHYSLHRVREAPPQLQPATFTEPWW
jgi:hypothetical protein